MLVVVFSEGLEDYLAALGHSGDAPSHFTIEPTQALAKMAAYELPSPGLWAVKFVQGAVAAGAARVDFTLNGREIDLTCSGDFQVSADSLLVDVLANRVPEDRSSRHWVTAIRAALGKRPQTMSVVSRCNGQTQTHLVEKATIVAASEEHRRSLVTRFQIRTSCEPEWVRGASPEIKELIYRCRLCPIPVTITVNGRDIPVVSTPYFTSWLEPANANEPHLCLAYPRKEGTESFHCTVDGDICHPQGKPQRCGFFFGATLGTGGGERSLYWMRDGALVGPVALPKVNISARVDIVVPGDPCTTDISNWSLREPDSTVHFGAINDAIEQLGHRVWNRKLTAATRTVGHPLPWLVIAGSWALLGSIPMATLTTLGFIASRIVKIEPSGLPSEILWALSEIPDSDLANVGLLLRS